MPKLLFETSQKLIPAMKERDSDEQKLAQGRKAEKEAEAEYKAVHEQSNDQKMIIAANAKQAEAEMK